MTMTKEQRLANIHHTALQQFDDIQSALRDERRQCLEDRRFYSIAGAQWEGALGQQFANKPKFEINKVHLAVIKIINEYRNNRLSVRFTAKGDNKNSTLADTCAGLYRADEKASCAQEAYDNGFEEAVGGGMGAWRLRAKYEDDEDFDNDYQRIDIEPIFDADSSVFFDLDAKKQDKSDAKYCFVITSMTHDKYEAEYGASPSTWHKDNSEYTYDWCTPDVVYVAEYFVVEMKKTRVQIWETITGDEERYKEEEFKNDPELEGRLMAQGSKFDRAKPIKVRRVRKYIMDGRKVIEDCGYIAGKNIPIVPVYGKRWFVDNIERCMGHVRLAKDIQRIKNMQTSKLGELSSLSSTEKPIFTPEQMSGHQTMWSKDSIDNYPYMLVNPMTDASGNPVAAGPIGYTKPPQIPPALAALLQVTDQDMQDLLGTQQTGDELQPNISGVAVELIQNKLDMQTFIYVSNMAKAVKRSGEIWLSMARDIFVEKGRKLKTVSDKDETDTIELMRPSIDENTGAMIIENDISEATFEVDVDVGPSSASRRASVVRAVTGMMSITDDPETKQVLGAMAMLNMEGEGIGDVRDFFRNKLLKMGVLKPTKEEAVELAQAKANEPPDPNTQYLNAAADEAQAKAVKARADTVLTITKAEESKANTMKIVADVDVIEQQQALEVIDRFGMAGGSAPQPAQPAVTAPPVSERDMGEPA